MAKKIFGMPFVIAMSTGESEVVGPGSGGSTPDIDEPWDYETWGIIAQDFPAIYNLDTSDEEGSWNDYVLWWQSHSGWDEETFKAINGVGYDGNP